MRTSLREDERGTVGAERIAVWILALLAVAFAVAVVVEPGVLAASPPDASFEEAFDDETNTLRIEHAGGDAIRPGPTSALVVVVRDGDSDNVRNVTWVADGDDGVGSFPVEAGDDIAIDDSTVDADDDGSAFDGGATVGFELDDGDVVQIRWRGRPFGAAEQMTVTLDRAAVPPEE